MKLWRLQSCLKPLTKQNEICIIMKVSEKIVIDLTESLANVGVPVPFSGNFDLRDDLLPYPNAKLTNVNVNFDVVFTKPNVEVTGTIQCFVDGFCDRCAERVERQIELPFEQTFSKDAEDADSYVYAASKLDATKAVEDEIVLGVPTLLLCKEDCKGLCPKCGANLNKTVCGCESEKENAFSVLKNIKF